MMKGAGSGKKLARCFAGLVGSSFWLFGIRTVSPAITTTKLDRSEFLLLVWLFLLVCSRLSDSSAAGRDSIIIIIHSYHPSIGRSD